MSKFIVENKSHLSDIEILPLISIVFEIGRVSANETAYCYVTAFEMKNIVIYATKNKASDKFSVHTYKHKTTA